MWPLDTTGEEEHSKPVVLEVTETVSAALHLLNAEVLSFGGSVAGAGAVMVQDLRPPAVRRPA